MKESAGNGRRRLEGNSGRDMGDGAGLGDYPVAETGRAEADNLISWRESACLAADAPHDSGKFKTQSRAGKTVFDGFVGEQAKGIHDVTEIESGGVDFDFDFIVSGRNARVSFPTQITQLARKLEAEAYRWRFDLLMFLCLWSAAQGEGGAHSERPQLVRMISCSLSGCSNSLSRAVATVSISHGIFQIDQADSVVGGFVDQRSTESP